MLASSFGFSLNITDNSHLKHYEILQVFLFVDFSPYGWQS
ncbi:hypothetical protein AM1_4227 [Acaryochloris marina MBIC11017]|uniref:Uncharacterized protein n=1 Tax=Acaryochloris marina (strain MBIC 11017) TaxID=329726 RepID=B0CCP6_ACAM1|nr:hypothetical protein AM1_4227 [Acaryochloris marina MBIC11017]